MSTRTNNRFIDNNFPFDTTDLDGNQVKNGAGHIFFQKVKVLGLAWTQCSKPSAFRTS